MSNVTISRSEYARLKESFKVCSEAYDERTKEINELKKKRSQGEINEAYAETIQRMDIERQKQAAKINKLEQKNIGWREAYQRGHRSGREQALDDAIKIALDFHESKGGRSNTAHIVANKIKELKDKK